MPVPVPVPVAVAVPVLCRSERDRQLPLLEAEEMLLPLTAEGEAEEVWDLGFSAQDLLGFSLGFRL